MSASVIPDVGPPLGCDLCGKTFEEPELVEVHRRVHTMGGGLTVEREVLYQEVKKQHRDVPDTKNPLQNQKPRRIYRPPSKRVGLTKIRMEDCLRCDACSCIYIDERDYYKHMRNFHEKYNTLIPRIRRKSPSNIKYKTISLPQAVPPSPSAPQLGQLLEEQAKPEQENIKENIKNRWSKVLSRRLIFEPPKIKTEIEDFPDISPLLQVEVKIKTEPPDE